RDALSAAFLLYEAHHPGAPPAPCGRDQARHRELRLSLGAQTRDAQGRAQAPRPCRGAGAGRRRHGDTLSEPLAFWVAATIAVTMLGLSKGGFAGMGALALPLIALTISPVQAAAILLPVLIVQDV